MANKCRQDRIIARGKAEKIWCHRHHRKVAINSDETGERSCGDIWCPLSPAYWPKRWLKKVKQVYAYIFSRTRCERPSKPIG